MKAYTLLITQLGKGVPRRAAEEKAEQRLFGGALTHDSSGKPLLDRSPFLAVSISHSHHWLTALIVPFGIPAGIDIEEKALQAERTLERYSTETERKLLIRDGLSPLHLWTAKEALYKAFSKDLSKGVNQITFEGVDKFAVHLDDGKTEYQLIEWIEWQGALIAHNIVVGKLKIEEV